MAKALQANPMLSPNTDDLHLANYVQDRTNELMYKYRERIHRKLSDRINDLRTGGMNSGEILRQLKRNQEYYRPIILLNSQAKLLQTTCQLAAGEANKVDQLLKQALKGGSSST